MKTDSRLQQDVLDEIKWDPEVDETKIGVAVTDGAVTLTGHAASYAQKLATKRAAMRVRGVQAVVDKIGVRLGNQYHTTDDALAQRVAHVLTHNISTPGDIKAEVNAGHITLRGELDWQYQRTNILKNIEHIAGVISVTDLMTLKAKASASDIHDRIAAALRRHADVEASTIKVSASGGTVTLTGTVDSLAEMDRVERTAWAAPGVTKVVDQLRVA